MFLTKDQIGSFKENGYLILKNILDTDLCDKAYELMTNFLPDNYDPKLDNSWNNKFKVDCVGEHSLIKLRGMLKLQEEVRHEPLLHDLLPNNSKIKQIMNDLLGSDYFCPKIRGIYPNLPIPKKYSFPYQPHYEGHLVSLVVVGYLNDILPNGGALNVWPGSHLGLYEGFKSKLANEKRNGFKKFFRKFAYRDPVELLGKKGDIVIFHNRLLHSGSNNNQRYIRTAIFCDFLKNDYKDLANEEPNLGKIWEDWSPNIRNLKNEKENDLKSYKKLNFSLSRYFWYETAFVRKLFKMRSPYTAK